MLRAVSYTHLYLTGPILVKNPAMLDYVISLITNGNAKKQSYDSQNRGYEPVSYTHLPHTKFKGHVYVLTKDEGGRHTPFFNNYRPQFYFRTTDVTGVITLPADKEMCMPGDNVETVCLLYTSRCV